jgi:predicted nucleic acid-binding protein
MKKDVVRVKTPEEEELDRKRARLAQLQAQLAERELELATLAAELGAFERRYLRIVGLRYAQLDKLEAEIAEFFAKQKPSDREAQKRAEQAHTQARESAEATGEAETFEGAEEFAPSESLKRLYREIARRFHPDLTDDPEEKKRRHRIMAEATNAYERGDEARLREILAELETSPEAVTGEGPGAELVRVIRKIAQVQRRLRAIAEEIKRLTESELYELKAKVEEAAAESRDLLAEMAERLDRQINDATQRLGELKQRGAT